MNKNLTCYSAVNNSLKFKILVVIYLIILNTAYKIATSANFLILLSKVNTSV